MCKIKELSLCYVLSDEDECLTQTCVDNAECVNTVGSWECVCLAGYAEDGNLCIGNGIYTHSKYQLFNAKRKICS